MKCTLLMTFIVTILMPPFPITADQRTTTYQVKKQCLRKNCSVSNTNQFNSSPELPIGNERLNIGIPLVKARPIGDELVAFIMKQGYCSGRAITQYKNRLYVCDFENEAIIDVTYDVLAIELDEYGYIPASKIFLTNYDLYVPNSTLKKLKAKKYDEYCGECKKIYYGLSNKAHRNCEPTPYISSATIFE